MEEPSSKVTDSLTPISDLSATLPDVALDVSYFKVYISSQIAYNVIF